MELAKEILLFQVAPIQVTQEKAQQQVLHPEEELLKLLEQVELPGQIHQTQVELAEEVLLDQAAPTQATQDKVQQLVLHLEEELLKLLEQVELLKLIQ